MRRGSIHTLTPLCAGLAVFACTQAEGPVAPSDDPEPAVASVTVSAPAVTLTSLGETVQLSAAIRDQTGAPVQATLTWASSNAAVATVDPTGRVTAVSDGQTSVTATAGGITGTSSATVAQTAVALSFAPQPSSGTVGSPLAQVAVEIVDQLGSVVAGAEENVILSLAPNASGAALSGTTAVQSASGVATFTDLRVDRVGTAYRLRAISGGLSAESDPFDVDADFLPFDNFRAADFAIGQADLGSGQRNAGQGTVNALGVRNRGTVAGGGGPFYMADGGNSRVLGYNAMPRTSGVAADFVLGQPDFASGDRPQGNELNATNFIFPGEVVVSDGKLFVNDFNSGRILIWNSLPRTTNAPADVVVGQPNFSANSRGTSSTTMNFPAFYTVVGGRLIVSDQLNHRVLIWNTIPTANGAPADLVLGQPDFTSNVRGRSATALSNPQGIWSDGQRLVLADGGNRRVLIWNSMPTTNQAPADLVLGAASLNAEADTGVSARSLGRPVDVVSDGTTLFITDQENARVLMFRFPTENGEAAVGVLGQSDFTLSAPNDPNQDNVSEDVVSARTLGEGPSNLALIGDELFVSDVGNARVLVFRKQR